MKYTLLLLACSLSAQEGTEALATALNPIRIIDTGWKTASLRGDSGSLYVLNERGATKITGGIPKVLSVAPLWSSDVSRDDARFKGVALMVKATRDARIKVRPKDGIGLVLFKVGVPEQWNFDSTNAAVLKQSLRPLNIKAPAGFPVVRAHIVAAALDGKTVVVLYGAKLAGDVMVVGRFTRHGSVYTRREFSIRLPKTFHLMPHIAASGNYLWIGNENKLIAEYQLGAK